MLEKYRNKILVIILLFAALLRFCNLSSNPPSMFGDELDVGYHAYSILKTGKDYQGNLLPLNFHSLAEWRTPLYLYSAVPTVAIFGVSPLGVRIPAALFGLLGVYLLYLLVKEIFDDFRIGILAATILAISPWHIQYSRAGFEVTEMIAFLIAGIYFFLRSLKKNRYLYLSVLFFILTAYTYSTAKVFTPILMLFILFIWKKEIQFFEKKQLIKTLLTGFVLGLPLVYSIVFVGGAQRFNYISVFADPTTEAEVGVSRSADSFARGETGLAQTPRIFDRIAHNKFTYWGNQILVNYFKSFSTNFLFIKGDPNPRQSVGIGEFYKIEALALVFGLIFLFINKRTPIKNKILLVVWLLMAPIPASLTKDGGDHATRLILMLPPIIAIIALGWSGLYDIFTAKRRIFYVFTLTFLYVLSFIFYMHQYLVHYPVESERWWHYGWSQALETVKKLDTDYDRVIISMAGEPAWIFFAAHYQYDPSSWQLSFPIGNDIQVEGFGKISHTGKYYFGTPSDDVQIYGLSRVVDNKTLYLANAKEVGENLILHPDKKPQGLKLIKSVSYLSGEPAFYIFTSEK